MVNTLQQRILQHQFLSNLRINLLYLHKMLLNAERITYEQVRGNVSSRELLHLVINHDRFAWLHQLSQLVLQIDPTFRTLNCHNRKLRRKEGTRKSKKRHIQSKKTFE